MAHGRSRDERKEQQWRRRIEQWRSSGLSVRTFCARHGLATASFYNWRRVLQRRGVHDALVQLLRHQWRALRRLQFHSRGQLLVERSVPVRLDATVHRKPDVQRGGVQWP